MPRIAINSFIIIILSLFLIRLPIAAQSPTPANGSKEKTTRTRVPWPELPYKIGVEYSYSWIFQGVEVAKTTFWLETVQQEDQAPQLIARGTLDYSRAGRVLTGSSEIRFADGTIRQPVRYRRSLTTSASVFGEETTDIAVRFEEGKATLSRKDDAPQLHRRELPLRDPIWILDDQCFEHWVLLGPYLRQVAPDGAADLFVPFAASVPTSDGVMPYTIRHERTEGEGEERRDRWQIETRALKAKLWTDHRGRVVEYLQENSHILLTGEKERNR